MADYKNKEELVNEISKRSQLFIKEFEDINEQYKDKLIDEVDRTPSQMIAYQIGWMKLILDWERKEKQGEIVITPTKEYKWNKLGGLYESFYKEYDEYSLKDLCIIFEGVKNEIIELVNSYSDDELFEQGKIGWASSTPSNWPVYKWIHINTVAPFKSFRTKIRKWKKLKQG